MSNKKQYEILKIDLDIQPAISFFSLNMSTKFDQFARPYKDLLESYYNIENFMHSKT